MENEVKKKAATSLFLGLSGAEDGLNEYHARLRKIWPEAEDVNGPFPDFAAMRERILLRRQPVQPKYHRLSRIFWLPVAALALILVGILYLNGKNTSPEIIFESTAALASKQNLARGVEMTLKSAKQITVLRLKTGILIRSVEISAFFDYRRSVEIRDVAIETPHVRFEVIGTKFQIDVSRETASLKVIEGKVKVTADGETVIIAAGSEWTRKKQKDGRDTGHKSRSIEIQKAPVKVVRVTLRNGTQIAGELLSENPELLRLRVAALGNEVIEIKRDKVAQISPH